MASGKTHTKATIILAALTTPAILTPYPLIPLGITLGLWLSPDLDTKSDPYNRWGIIKLIWWPYQKLYNHRSPWTHLPILSTTIRLLYISPIIYLAGLDTNTLTQLTIGLILSDTLHAIMDL